MAIPEACGLWIEQRVQEELENKGDTGASLREIGRIVAGEVEKYFETRVNPLTIANRASRMNRSVSNDTPSENQTKTISKPEIKEIKRAKDGTLRGGVRVGAGRKPKEETAADFGHHLVTTSQKIPPFLVTIP